MPPASSGAALAYAVRAKRMRRRSDGQFSGCWESRVSAKAPAESPAVSPATEGQLGLSLNWNDWRLRLRWFPSEGRSHAEDEALVSTLALRRRVASSDSAW